MNAFVTRGRRHILVAISSGAVNHLAADELEFVIGHELGHTLFGHIDVTVAALLDNSSASPRSKMQALAWKRSAEISADRVGLLCCRSLETAATALFKTLSGLATRDLRVDPDAFSNQWEHLKQEVLDSGGSDHWQLTHPFPPLRMQALKVFWRTLDSSSDAAQADHEVSRLLALMDPLAREGGDGADPVLADFFLWGGLYVALSNGELHASEVDKIVSISSQERLDKALSAGAPSMDACLRQFRECIESRQRKLKALEIHRILQGLLAVAQGMSQ